MNQQTAHNAYSRANHTVPKTRQVVMLYDGAIRFMKQAIEAIGAKDYETRYHKLTRVSDILVGLQACLDFNAGGEAANALYDYYARLDLLVYAVHRSNEIAACERIIADLKAMRDVWDRIDRGELSPAGGQAAMASAAAAAGAAPAGEPVKVSV